MTHDLRVVSLSPMLGVGITLKKWKKKEKKKKGWGLREGKGEGEEQSKGILNSHCQLHWFVFPKLGKIDMSRWKSENQMKIKLLILSKISSYQLPVFLGLILGSSSTQGTCLISLFWFFFKSKGMKYGGL